MKLTLSQAAARWGWSRSKLYRVAILNRAIPAVQVGKTWHFDSDALDRWWDAQAAKHVAREEEEPPTVQRDRRDERAALGLPDRHLFVS